MKHLRIPLLVPLLLVACACASTRYDTLVQHAVDMCRQLGGPDALKGQGDASFSFRSERADASRKLWNRRGLEAIETRQAAPGSPVEFACLAQLHQEASTRELVRE
jgi:hypothetical protein